MCHRCNIKFGNSYAHQLPSYLRPVVDAARGACNSSRVPSERLSMVSGGIAAVASQRPSFGDDISAQSLFSDVPHEHAFTAISATLPTVGVLAFETPDDSWPDATFFAAVHEAAVILRILHKNGNVQFWSAKEVSNHFLSAAAAVFA